MLKIEKLPSAVRNSKCHVMQEYRYKGEREGIVFSKRRCPERKRRDKSPSLDNGQTKKILYSVSSGQLAPD